MSGVEHFTVQTEGNTVQVEAYITRLHNTNAATKAQIILRQPEPRTRQSTRQIDAALAEVLHIPISAIQHYGWIPPLPERSRRRATEPQPTGTGGKPCARLYCRGTILNSGIGDDQTCSLCGRTPRNP